VGIALVALLWRADARAQSDDFQGWFQSLGHIGLDESRKYQLYLEVHPRLGDDWHRFERLLLRPALVYNPSRSVGLYLGYAWTPAFMNGDFHRDFRDEHRLWQQVVWRGAWRGFDWQHRLRQEQRFIERSDGVSNRSRYQFKVGHRLDPDDRFGLSVSDEFFATLNTIDSGPHAGYDRNRLLIGPYLNAGGVRYDLAYVSEHAKRFSGNDRIIQALMLMVSWNIE
jgi:hypothetical protein